MKRFLLTLFAIMAALAVTLSCVYAEPETPAEPQAEQAEQVAEPEETPLPIEEAETGIEVVMTLDVKLDTSSDFSYRQNLTDEIYGYYEQLLPQMEAQFEQMGLKVKLGNEADKKYLEFLGESGKGEPISFSSRGASDASCRFASKKGFFGTQYFVTANFDSRQSMLEADAEDARVFAQLTMNLPVGASYNDATLAENGNKTLTWNIAEGRINAISVMFTIPNIKNIAVLIGLIVILALIIVFSVLSKKKSAVTDAEIVEDTINHLEGEVNEDVFVEDPFASMTEEEINEEIEEEKPEDNDEQ